MRATIIDVAKQAGVSVATVSRVVNGNYPVKETTRSKVSKAIDELHYVPNIQARELNMQHSSCIGVVVPGFANMFFSEVLNGIEAYLRDKTYSLLLACGRNDSEQEEKCINDLVGRNVSGIIVVSPNTENFQKDFYQRIVHRVPLVFINSYTQIPHAAYVSNDEFAGARTALQHLYGYGHRQILFVRGTNSDSYRIKEEAYRKFMQEHELADNIRILDIGDGNSVETVDNAMFDIMDFLAQEDTTAIMCCNDLMGIGAVNACQRMERSVPGDISIVGYDNTALSRLTAPKLTTMDQNMTELGRVAGRLILHRADTSDSQHIVLTNSLVERETTGPCRD